MLFDKPSIFTELIHKTSSISSDSDSSNNSDRYRSKEYFDFEPVDDVLSEATYSSLQDSSDEGALCADDPLASAEWTARYEQEMRKNTEQEERMKDRLDGVVQLGKW
jgi:hypothetical protein